MEPEDLKCEADDRLASAGTYWAPVLSWHDIEMARSLLESAGIPVELPNEYAFRIDPPLKLMSGGQQLLVPQNRLAEAQELLSSRISDEELSAQAMAAAPETPPSDNDG